MIFLRVVFNKLLFILFICLSFLSSSYAGKQSGGGGNVVYPPNGNPILLDFYSAPSLVKSRQFHNIQKIISPSEFEVGALTDGRQNLISLSEKYPTVKMLFDLISSWSAIPFDNVAHFLSTAVSGKLDWIITNDQLPNFTPSTFGLVPIDSIILTGAYYSKETDKSRVLINHKTVNELNSLSRLGLFVHEGLRHVQIGFNQYFGELSLQQATAVLTLCMPSQRLNYYVFYLVYSGPELAKKIYGDFETFFEVECRIRNDIQ